jgi:hypothetical protein
MINRLDNCKPRNEYEVREGYSSITNAYDVNSERTDEV